jgi:hypothetical protein
MGHVAAMIVDSVPKQIEHAEHWASQGVAEIQAVLRDHKQCLPCQEALPVALFNLGSVQEVRHIFAPILTY